MKELSIIRLTPTTGQVLRMNWEGKRIPVDRPQNYGKCLDYVLQNQKDLKVYKVSRILHRKNGKRRLICSIYAEDNNEAVRFFDLLTLPDPDADYQLTTGDWKIIGHCMVVNGIRGNTIIENH